MFLYNLIVNLYFSFLFSLAAFAFMDAFVYETIYKTGISIKKNNVSVSPSYAAYTQ